MGLLATMEQRGMPTPFDLAPGDAVKPQTVRVLDVVAIGPLMVWGGLRLSREEGLTRLGGIALLLMGGGTIWYNARNFQKVKLSQVQKTPQPGSNGTDVPHEG